MYRALERLHMIVKEIAHKLSIYSDGSLPTFQVTSFSSSSSSSFSSTQPTHPYKAHSSSFQPPDSPLSNPPTHPPTQNNRI